MLEDELQRMVEEMKAYGDRIALTKQMERTRLRTGIASAAMQALIDRGSTWQPEEVAPIAVRYADALLAELEKDGK